MACQIRLLLCSAAFLVHTAGAMAQTKPAAPKKKTYCNPLVSGQPSTKRLSLQMELQPVHKGPTLFQGIQPLPLFNTNSSPAQNIRLSYNKNLVTKPKLYMTFAASYWFSSFNVTNAGNNSFARLLDNSRFHSLSVSSNIFKPINGKNFLLVNISAEANGNASSFENFSGDNLLAGGAIIYGWKKGLAACGGWVYSGATGWVKSFMYLPCCTTRPLIKMGVDALLPARANFRYRPAASVLWQFGYELEGTQFALSSSNNFYNRTFFQRGEIRPKIGMEKQFKKNWAFTWNAGLRLNGRFDVSSDYNGKQLLAETNPKPSLFVNAGVHVVNFVKKKKK